MSIVTPVAFCLFNLRLNIFSRYYYEQMPVCRGERAVTVGIRKHKHAVATLIVRVLDTTGLTDLRETVMDFASQHEDLRSIVKLGDSMWWRVSEPDAIETETRINITFKAVHQKKCF